MKIRLSLGILILSLIGCAGRDILNDRGLHDFDSAPLMGMIYSSENTPIGGVMISLIGLDTDEAASSSVSDGNGRFKLVGLKKGENRIRISKDGYAALTLDLRFDNPTDVFYTRLYSLGDLLEKAEEEIDEKDWNMGRNYVDSALKIDPESIEARFLYAVLLAGEGRGGEAEDLLQEIAAQGYPQILDLVASEEERYE